MLNITIHAVERLIKHWRRGLSYVEGHATLTQLVARSTPTRRKSLPGNAWIHVAETRYGERICLVVRDDTVITVLSERAGATYGIVGVLRSHAQALRAIDEQRARLAAWVHTEHAAHERLKAEHIVAAANAGKPVRSKALRRARLLLGLPE